MVTKRLFYTLTFLLIGCAPLLAQTTITNSIFPQAGTANEISTVINIPGSITLTSPSASAQAWDFTDLVTETVRTDTILAASTGAAFSSFPNTEIIQPIVAGFGTAYVDVSSTEVLVFGAGIEFFGLAFIEPYVDGQILQKAPLVQGTGYTDDFELHFEEHIDSVPFLRELIDSFASGLPISPDSIRLNVTGEHIAVVDAFGTCEMYDGTYDVLRQRVEQYTYFSIDVYLPSPLPFIPGSWIDVTSFLTGAIPFPIPEADTTYYYDYLAEGYQQPIVRMNMDNLGLNIESIEFKGFSDGTVSSVLPIETQNNYTIYPNPARNILQITHNYNTPIILEITDLQGRIISSYNLTNQQQQISIQDLPAGSYITTLRDPKGYNILENKTLLKQ